MSHKNFSSAQRASSVHKSNDQTAAAPTTTKLATQSGQTPIEVAPTPKS